MHLCYSKDTKSPNENRRSNLLDFSSVYVVALSIFPDIGIHLANIIGIESPVNFIYLVIIFMALEKIFSLSVKSSQLEYQISILTAEIAIWRNQMEQEGKK